MILEALNLLTTLCISPRRRPSEINSSVMLWARAERCADAWRAHEENCKAFISSVIDGLGQRRTAVVLGSGLLRDVPIMKLAKCFRHVVLVDLQHLASVRLRTRLRGISNVRYESRDISGLSDDGRCAENPLAFLDAIEDLDLVISANVLSQIGVGLSRAKGFDEAGIGSVLSAHIHGLKRLSCPFCLITDTGFRVLDRAGTVLESQNLMHGADLPEAAQTWQWTVIPFGEQSREWQAIHEVRAIRIDPGADPTF